MKKLAVALCLFAVSALGSPGFAGDDKQPSQAHPADLMVTTTSSFDGYKVRDYKGVVRGVAVRQPTIGQAFSANFERLKGGDISAYVNMCETTRRVAYEKCLDRARELGANAVMAMSFDSAGFQHGTNVATEVICYGTAVTIERDDKLSDSGRVRVARAEEDEAAGQPLPRKEIAAQSGSTKSN